MLDSFITIQLEMTYLLVPFDTKSAGQVRLEHLLIGTCRTNMQCTCLAVHTQARSIVSVVDNELVEFSELR